MNIEKITEAKTLAENQITVLRGVLLTIPVDDADVEERAFVLDIHKALMACANALGEILNEHG